MGLSDPYDEPPHTPLQPFICHLMLPPLYLCTEGGLHSKSIYCFIEYQLYLLVVITTNTVSKLVINTV